MISRTVSSSNYPIKFFLVDANDHVTGLIGLGTGPAVYIDKNGGGFGAASGGVTELSYGWYQWTPSATDRNTKGELSVHITGTGADPCDFNVEIVAADLDTIGANVSDVLTDTGTTLDGKIDTIDGIVDAIKVITDYLSAMLETDGAVKRYTANALEQGSVGGGLDAAGVRTAIGLASANLDTQLETIHTGVDDAQAIALSI